MAIFLRLMRQVPDRELRRIYRRRLVARLTWRDGPYKIRPVVLWDQPVPNRLDVMGAGLMTGWNTFSVKISPGIP